jgi:hypothetical protein
MLRREWNVTQSQIANAVRNNIKVKNQRRATVNNLGKAAKFEEMLERTQRTLKRGLLFQKSTTQQAHELSKRAQEIEKLRAEVFGVDDEDRDQEEYGTEENPIDTEIDDDDEDTTSHDVTAPELHHSQAGGRLTAETEDMLKDCTGVKTVLEASKENQSPPRGQPAPVLDSTDLSYVC